MKKILITGAAGFIGFNLSNKLKKKYKVLGIDNINNYYSPFLKKNRIYNLISKNFKFKKVDIKNYKILETTFKNFKPEIIINLAAQAGVRYSLKNPKVYLDNNINGFFNILELSKKYKVKHLLFASSSSVYGKNKDKILKISSNTDKPISFYAFTKKANELMAHYYSHMFKLKITGLRLFTVYGPWGRPDMSLYKFVKNILKRKSINIFNHGKHQRSFTYIDDAINQISKLIELKEKKLFNIYNIGGAKPIKLLTFIKLIEKNLNIKGSYNFLPIQKGDVEKTNADISKTIKKTKISPKIDIDSGIKKFIDWYKKFNSIK